MLHIFLDADEELIQQLETAQIGKKKFPLNNFLLSSYRVFNSTQYFYDYIFVKILYFLFLVLESIATFSGLTDSHFNQRYGNYFSVVKKNMSLFRALLYNLYVYIWLIH